VRSQRKTTHHTPTALVLGDLGVRWGWGFGIWVLSLILIIPVLAQQTMNELAEQYVKLVLAVGPHDADYVDAYYGPPGWRMEAEAAKVPLATIDARAQAVLRDLERQEPGGDEMARLRHQYLTRQIEALRGRVAMLQGVRFSFDDESRALYDAVAPTHSEAEFESTLQVLDRVLPGQGTLAQRLDAFRAQFVIPKDRLDKVFTAAIAACRERTLKHIELPAGESFTVEYVTGKNWSGYNWYQGGYRSLIQVNTDLPIYASRAIDLACHEGYPGHHAYNALLEKHLMRDRGWMEYSVYPLFSPQSLIAEGTANFGIEVAFGKADRLAFEQQVLFPLAGLDPAMAPTYYEVIDLTDRLSYAGNEAARRYLNGQIDANAAMDWHERYLLSSRPRAEQQVRFVDQYRSYVINYNLGKDLVAQYIASRGGTADKPERRWEEFARLISSPRLPSGLR